MFKNGSLLLFSTLALYTAACSRSKTYSTSEGKVSVKENGKDAGSVSFTGKDGQKVTMDYGNGKIPADYPKDVPVYKNATVTMSQSLSEKNGRNLILQSDDAADKIVEFYQKELESNGWKTGSTTTVNEMTTITAEKSNRQLALQVTNSEGKRTILQTVSNTE